MSKKANTAMIGVFVIGAVVLAVVGILAFSSGTLFKDTDQFVLFFDGDLQGLSIGAPVLFQGVPVGQVTDIRVYYKSGGAEFAIPVLIETDPDRFHEVRSLSDQREITHEIDPEELEELIRRGLRAQLTLQSMVTGQLAIRLGMLPDTPVNLRGGYRFSENDGEVAEIPTVPSSFERLASALEKLDLGNLVDNINRAMNALEKMIDEQALENLVADFQSAAKEAATLARELRAHAVVVTDEIQKSAQSARVLMKSLDDQVDPVAGEAIQTMEDAQKALAQAEESLIKIEHLAADYSADSDFGYELVTALNEIAATARSVRALTDMLQQQPDALLRGKSASGGE